MADVDKELLLAVDRVIETCATMPMDDRLIALQLAWTLLAQQARTDALTVPGEFQAQQSSQLGQLEKIALLVREDTPGIELDERLTLEGDFEGVLRKLKSDREKGRGN